MTNISYGGSLQKQRKMKVVCLWSFALLHGFNVSGPLILIWKWTQVENVRIYRKEWLKRATLREMVCKWNLFDIFHQFYNDVEESIDSAKSAEVTKTSQAKTQMGRAPIRSCHIHIHQLHCLNTALIFDTMPTSASGLWPHSWTQVQPACKGVAAPELGALLVREHLT